MGIELEDVDFESISTFIKKREKSYFLNASRIQGVARVINVEAFEQLLLNNIANAKTYGFGFLSFTINEKVAS